MKYVIKYRGRSEQYDSKKVFASVYRTCLSCDLDHKRASTIAKQVTANINTWLNNKTEVSSNDIRAQVHKSLTKLNKQAGYLYAHHRIIA
jgi:transcriptional regulator NrdR family protein